jgi:hypothetical protein
MKISQTGLANLLIKYISTLEPVETGTTIGITTKKITNSDGTTSLKQTPQKGDAHIPENFANSIGKAIAKAVFEHIVGYIDDPVVDKINELITQYNQLRADVITGGISTTSTSVNKIPVT